MHSPENSQILWNKYGNLEFFAENSVRSRSDSTQPSKRRDNGAFVTKWIYLKLLHDQPKLHRPERCGPKIWRQPYLGITYGLCAGWKLTYSPSPISSSSLKLALPCYSNLGVCLILWWITKSNSSKLATLSRDTLSPLKNLYWKKVGRKLRAQDHCRSTWSGRKMYQSSWEME